MPEERRIVTVLFASVPGLSRAGGGGTDEDAAELADALFTRFRRTVEARGGTVDKFLGEDVMAVFGAPVAHEDDPLRAVRAAIAMRREVELFNAQRTLELGFSAGINAGEVLWGTVGGDRPTAMGDAVNVAKRLQESARAGAVLVGRAVERATGARIAYGPPADIELRGRAEKVEALEATGERTTASSSYGTAEAGPAKLVGREREMARLWELFEGGKGGFVAIEGESGVGKTRISAEFRQRAQARPRVWAGVGYAQEGVHVPLAPFAEMVRFAARGAGSVPGKTEGETTGAWVAEVLEAMVAASVERENAAHLITQSLGQHVGETRVRHIDPVRVRDETLLAWEKWARALAQRGPALFCLEDVHGADPGTLALMEHLAAKLAGERVMIVATCRPGGRALKGFERMALSELPADESKALACELLGARADDELGGFLVEHSGGNPLYLEELVRHLRQEHLVGGRPARFLARPERLPDGLRGLLVARIDTTSPEAREALKSGSVFGRAFWVRAVGTLLGRDAEGPIEQASRRQLVARQASSLLPEDSEFAFTQTPLRDAAYSLLTRKERLRLHARAADLLEPRSGELGRRVTILAAEHREAAEQDAAAARLWEQASWEAYRQGAYDEALGMARDAQRLGAGADAAIQSVRCLVALGQYDQAVAEAEEVLAVPGLSALDTHKALYQLASVLERRGDFLKSIEIFQRILDTAPVEVMRLDVLAARCGCHYRMANYAEAMADVEEIRRGALELERRGATRREVVAQLKGAANNRARVHYQLGRHRETMEAYQECLALNREQGDPSGEATALNGIGIAHNALGDMKSALEYYEKALAVFRAMGDKWKIAMVLTNVANVHFAQGRVDESMDAAREGLAIRRDIGDRWGGALILSNIGGHHLALGNYSLALETLGMALADYRTTGDRQGTARALRELAQVRLETGDLAGAREAADEAVRICEGIQAPRRLLEARLRQAEVLAASEKEAGAEPILEGILQGLDPSLRAEIGSSARAALSHLRRAARPAEASRDAEEALALAREDQNVRREAVATGALADAQAALGQFPQALENILRAKSMLANERAFPDGMRLLEIELRVRLAAGDRDGALAAAREGERLAGEKGALAAAARFRALLL
ncbi:MAG: tetratricopeptide repeat protein [Planctomycetes bacterium]|nr:tetratricopeptide repeat protein [Planctomycetota bacterium]